MAYSLADLAPDDPFNEGDDGPQAPTGAPRRYSASDLAPDQPGAPKRYSVADLSPVQPRPDVSLIPHEKAPSPAKSEPAPNAPPSGPFSWLPSPRALAAGAVRIGGGWAANALADLLYGSSVVDTPAVGVPAGMAAGGAVGGGSERLAEWIEGHPSDPAAISVAAGTGMLPLGQFFKNAGQVGEGVTGALKAFAAHRVVNAAKGAALNVGVDEASRIAHGEPLGGTNEELLPAIIGAGGGYAASYGAGKILGAPEADAATARTVTPNTVPSELPGVPQFHAPTSLPGVPDNATGAMPTPAGATPMARWLNQPSFEDSLASMRPTAPAAPVAPTGDSVDHLIEMLKGGDAAVPRGTTAPEPTPMEGAPVAPPLEIETPAASQGAPTPAAPTEAPTEPRLASQFGPSESGPPSASPVIERLYNMLQPLWDRDNATAPEGVGPNPPQSLAEFEAETRGDDPRSLMWQQRQIRSKIDDGELGAINPMLLRTLGGAGAGAVAGPVVANYEGTDPRVAAVGGALTGAAIGAGPEAMQAIRSSNLLSGLALPKKFANDATNALMSAAEEPNKGAGLLSALLSKERFGDIGRAWRGETPLADAETGTTPTSAFEQSPVGKTLSAPGRFLAAVTEADKGAYRRAGFNPIDPEDIGTAKDPAARAAAVSYPGSQAGQALVDLVRKGGPVARAFLPFARTQVNRLEQGLERTPGIGSLPSVRAWTGASPGLALRRQAVAAPLIALNALAGYESAPGGELEDHPWLAKALPFLSGGAVMPGAVASAAGRSFATPSYSPIEDAVKASVAALNHSAPMPTGIPSAHDPLALLEQLLEQYTVPYGGATGAYYPVPQKQFDLSNAGVFGPQVARVPFVNESLLDIK